MKAEYPLLAPNYAAQRSDLPKSLGLGRKPKAVADPAACDHFAEPGPGVEPLCGKIGKSTREGDTRPKATPDYLKRTSRTADESYLSRGGGAGALRCGFRPTLLRSSAGNVPGPPERGAAAFSVAVGRIIPAGFSRCAETASISASTSSKGGRARRFVGGWLRLRVFVPCAARAAAHARLPLRQAGDYPVAIVSLSLECSQVRARFIRER